MSNFKLSHKTTKEYDTLTGRLIFFFGVVLQDKPFYYGGVVEVGDVEVKDFNELVSIEERDWRYFDKSVRVELRSCTVKKTERGRLLQNVRFEWEVS